MLSPLEDVQKNNIKVSKRTGSNFKCKICNKLFYVIPSKAKRNPKYCSWSCFIISMNKNEKTCLNCGCKYKPTRIYRNTKFCSLKCYHENISSRITTQCDICGKKITFKKSCLKRGKKIHCSRKCFGIFKQRQVKLNCLTCNKEFSVKESFMKDGRKYCSMKCRPVTHLPPPHKLAPMMTRCCRGCGEEYTIPVSEFRLGRIYCSVSCSHKFSARNNTIIQCPVCRKTVRWKNSKIKHGYKCCSMKCSRIYKPMSERIGAGVWKTARRFSDTDIELLIKKELDRIGLDYEHPYNVGPYGLKDRRYFGVFDFAIPSLKLAWECDGVFWHQSEKGKARDARKKTFCDNNGWTLLRFTDKQIKKDANGCILIVKKAIARLGSENCVAGRLTNHTT